MTVLPYNRRQFLKQCAAGTLLLNPTGNVAFSAVRVTQNKETLPAHLKEYEKLYRARPREASLAWFRDAQFGLFIHYGLYSLDGVHPFHQWNEKIPVAEYEERAQRFLAGKFDAGGFCDLAIEAGMKYVCFVTKHCEGFCLWNTKQSDFNSVNSPAKRDLVAEMVEACNKRGLGFFAFYEHGFDWHHAHGPRRTAFPKGPRILEVPYETPEPTYAHGRDYDLNRYVTFVHEQITELLTQYGPIAGIWLDGAAVPASGDQTKFKLQELYDHIHLLQPHALVSYKWGITGTEDFTAPEKNQTSRVTGKLKPVEMCWPLNDGWGWVKGAKHESADKVMELWATCHENQRNFLLNVGLLADGSVHPSDVKTLKEVGRRLRKQAANKPDARDGK